MEAAAGTVAAGRRPRVIGRRPTLPNGRAVVGGLLVAAAAVGTFAAWSDADAPPSGRAVVAARDLPIGTVVRAADLDVVAVDVPAPVAERAFARPDLVVGQRTVAPLATGELVQRSSVVVPESARAGRQLSFAIDTSSALAGTLEVGETVDLLATYGSSAAESSTEVVAAGAVIAGIPPAANPDGRTVLLVDLPPEADVLAVANATRHGALTVVRSPDRPLEPGSRYTPARERRSEEAG